MLKNKKLIMTMVIIVLIVLIATLANYLYTKRKYSFEKVQSMINSEKEISNIHINIEYKNSHGEMLNVEQGKYNIYDTYIKGNLLYSVAKNTNNGKIIIETFSNTKRPQTF